MGMFNYVDYSCDCQNCHSRLFDFQTKDGELLLDTVSPTSVDSFYALCDFCGCWTQFDKVSDDKFNRTVSQGREHLAVHDKNMTLPDKLGGEA